MIWCITSPLHQSQVGIDRYAATLPTAASGTSKETSDASHQYTRIDETKALAFLSIAAVVQRHNANAVPGDEDIALSVLLVDHVVRRDLIYRHTLDNR